MVTLSFGATDVDTPGQLIMVLSSFILPSRRTEMVFSWKMKYSLGLLLIDKTVLIVKATRIQDSSSLKEVILTPRALVRSILIKLVSRSETPYLSY